MNKSSSFYSQAYYQKARKHPHKKKSIYRAKRQELLDQQTQLCIHHYHYNITDQCSMITYFELLNEAYLSMKQQSIKNNQEYQICVSQFMRNIQHKIGYFHQHLISKRYLTRDQYIKLGISSAQQLKNYWIQQDALPKAQSDQTKGEVQSCNLCPLFVEQFEFNFARLMDVVMKGCEYWEQLNGHQKMSKYRWQVQQNLRVLQHQMQNKCQYAQPNKIVIKNGVL